MVQLREIVRTDEMHHPVLTSFSYRRLLMTVESYLDAYLERNPSDYLLKVQKVSHYHFLYYLLLFVKCKSFFCSGQQLGLPYVST